MSVRGGGQSRMLETLALLSAHAPLPASRLDMRACHPAEKLDQVQHKEVSTPRSRVSRERINPKRLSDADAS